MTLYENARPYAICAITFLETSLSYNLERFATRLRVQLYDLLEAYSHVRRLYS